jgi:hypothetical protein
MFLPLHLSFLNLPNFFYGFLGPSPFSLPFTL